MILLPDPALAAEALPPLDLPASRIDLWLVPAVNDIASVEQLATSWLSDEERLRLNSQRLPKGRAMFLLTRAVLRRLLSAYCPRVSPGKWLLGRSTEGRPVVLGPVAAPVFNLSHTDDMLVLAFAAQGEPGVDVEALDRELEAAALAQRFFSDAEYQALQSLPPAQQRDRFLRLWTLKEACVKANGQGLARALRDFEFAFADDLRFYPAPHESPPHRHWRLWSTTLAGMRIALALRSQIDPGELRLCVRQLSWPDQIANVACVAEFTGTT